MFRVEIDTRGASFDGPIVRELALMRILQEIREQIEAGRTGGVLYDGSNNRIGAWGFYDA